MWSHEHAKGKALPRPLLCGPSYALTVSSKCSVSSVIAHTSCCAESIAAAAFVASGRLLGLQVQ